MSSLRASVLILLGMLSVAAIPQRPVSRGQLQALLSRTTPLEVFDAGSYGAKGDGKADDTSAIQSALNAATGTNSGATVVLGPRTYLVSQVQIPFGVRLVGQGMLRTFLQAKGNNGGVPIVVLASPSVMFAGLEGITISGLGSNATCGIHLDNSTGSFTTPSGIAYSDPYLSFRDVMIRDINGNGWEIEVGSRSCEFQNCHAKANQRGGSTAFGTHVGFLIACTDSQFIDCVASTNGQSGFYVTGGNNRLINCVAFYNGALAATPGDDACGFRFEGASTNLVCNCFSQQNYAVGYLINDSLYNVFNGCVSDSNSGYNSATGLNTSGIGWRFSGTSRSNLATGIFMRNQYNSTVATAEEVGVQFMSGPTNNTFTGISLEHDNSSATTNILVADVDAKNNSIQVGSLGSQSIGYGASITVNPYLGRDVYVGTLTGNITVNAPANPSYATSNPWIYPTQRLKFVFTQDGTGGRTVNWNSVFRTNSAWSPVTSAGAINTIEFYYDGILSKWVQAGCECGA